jgi:hypothetical protein
MSVSKDFKRTKELKTFDDQIQSELDQLSPEEIIMFLTKEIDKYENMLLSVRYIRDRLNIEMHLDIYKNKLEEFVKFIDDDTLQGLWQGYPDLNDPKFNFKIYNKEEFNRYKIKKQGIDGFIKEETMEFVKNPTQNFIGAYMSPSTPFNSILLWLGVGVGKTCAALTAAENYRRDGGELTRSKITVLLPADSLIQSWKNQIFNLKKDLKNTNKNINVQCTGDTFKKEMDFYDEMTLDSKIRKVNKVINKYYEFMGYRKFANTVDKEINEIIKGREDRENLKIEFIRKKYSNRIFILDEVHFTRQYANNKNKNKDIAEKLELIARYGENNKFILASATPMYNSAIEIIEILNIMLLNDRRAPIEGYQVFKSDGYELTENGREILIQKSRGYISYLRGENPITFPIKIYPELSIASGDAVNSYIPNPLYTLKKGELIQLPEETKIKDLSFIKCPMSKTQYDVYKLAAHGEEDLEEDEEDTGDGDNFSIPSTVASNLVYPIGKAGNNIICLQGDKGFTEAFHIIAPTNENKSNLQYRYSQKAFLDNDESFLTEDNLNNFSSKFYNILQLVKRSEGICFFYSKYLKPGIVSLALMLEQNGYARFAEGNMTSYMLYDQPSFQRCFCGLTNKEPHPKYDKTKPLNNENHPFTQGRYIFLTGQTPKNTLNYYIDQCNGEGESTSNNLWGQHIKFVLGSNVLEQGINLYNVREVHVIDPWHHLNRTEQVVGRAIRNFSHKNLPPNKRNVSVYLYCATIPVENELLDELRIETTDEKTYRHAYYKSKKIAIITRLFKQNAVDCLLNKNGNQLTVEYFGNTPLHILTSQNKTLKNEFYGDHDYDIICDYDKCNYDCFGQPDGPYEFIPTNKDTYDDILAIEDLSQGKKYIGRLYLLKNAYTVEEMLNLIDRYDQNITDKLLFRSLNSIVTNRESLYDNYHREGTIIYKHPYYIFQPKELDIDSVSFYTRSIPLPIRNTSIIVSHVNDTLVKIPKKEVKLDDEKVFIDEFRNFIDNVGQLYIHKNTIYGDLADEINSEFLLALTDNNPDPSVGFDLLELYFVFSVIDRLSYDEKRILISYVLENNIKNGGVKDPNNKLENAIFEMYEPNNGSTRNSIFRLDSSGLPNVFRLYKSVYYSDSKKRIAEAFFFQYNKDTQAFEPVESLDLINYRTEYGYTYDQLKIDYVGDIVYGYIQEKERRSMAKLKAEEEIGEFKNEIEFYLVDKLNHKSKTNKDDSRQHKSEIKGAVCGTATYLNINKPELIDLIQYLLGTNSKRLEKFLDSKSKTNKHEDIYRVFAKSGSVCELIELLLRHKQYISPKKHFFFNFDEWEFMRAIRSEQEAAEKKKIEEQKKMKQPRGRKPLNK